MPDAGAPDVVQRIEVDSSVSKLPTEGNVPGSIVTSTPLGEPPPSKVSPQIEAKFYRELEEQARAFYRTHRDQMPDVQEDLWSRMTRRSIHRLRQAKLAGRDLIRFARPAARTFVITNVLSTFVLPPMLTAVGLPNLAVLVLATPFEPFVAAGQVMILRMLDDVQLLRQLGWSRYRELKQLRHRLLQVSDRQHLITLLHSDMLEEMQKFGGPLWVAISKKKPFFSAEVVSLKELEELVARNPEGRRFLEILTPTKTQADLYALELWMFIEETPELRRQLLARFRSKARSPLMPNAEYSALRGQMHELIDLKRAAYDNEIEFSATVEKSLKRLPREERAEIQALLDETGEAIRASVRAADAAEMRILLRKLERFGAYGAQVPPEAGSLIQHVRRLQEQIAALKSAQKEATALLEDRFVTAASLRKTLRLDGFDVVTVSLAPRGGGLPCPQRFTEILR